MLQVLSRQIPLGWTSSIDRATRSSSLPIRVIGRFGPQQDKSYRQSSSLRRTHTASARRDIWSLQRASSPHPNSAETHRRRSRRNRCRPCKRRRLSLTPLIHTQSLEATYRHLATHRYLSSAQKCGHARPCRVPRPAAGNWLPPQQARHRCARQRTDRQSQVRRVTMAAHSTTGAPVPLQDTARSRPAERRGSLARG